MNEGNHEDVEMIQFSIGGAGPESRTAYMSMPKERYLRIMPPFLTDKLKVIEQGNLDEGCYQNGHTWDADEPYLGDLRNGVLKRCLLCGQSVLREWSAREWPA